MHELTTYYNRGGELRTIKGRTFDVLDGDEQLIPAKALMLITAANFEMQNVSKRILSNQMNRCAEPATFAMRSLLGRIEGAAISRGVIKIINTPKWRLRLLEVKASLRKRFSRKAVIKNGN